HDGRSMEAVLWAHLDDFSVDEFDARIRCEDAGLAHALVLAPRPSVCPNAFHLYFSVFATGGVWYVSVALASVRRLPSISSSSCGNVTETNGTRLPWRKPSIRASSFLVVRLCRYEPLVICSIGAEPHAPRHSASLIVNSPSSVVSPALLTSFYSWWCRMS